MDTNARIEFSCDVIGAVIRRQQTRLQNGLRKRNEMFRDMDEHGVSDGYRYEWLKSSVLSVIDELNRLGAEFNRQFPEDRASLDDYLDVLFSATETLKGFKGSDQ